MIKRRIKNAFPSFKQEYEVNGMSIRNTLKLRKIWTKYRFKEAHALDPLSLFHGLRLPSTTISSSTFYFAIGFTALRCSKLALPPKIVAHASLFFDGFLPLHKHVTFFTNISLVKFAFRIVLLPCKLVEFMRYLMNFSYVTSYKTTSLLVISIA